MRPRFLGVSGPLDDEARTAIASRLEAILPTHLRQGELSLFLASDTPWFALPETPGFLLGHLFAADTGAPLTSLPSAFARATDSTGGRHLLQHCWGAYAALWHDVRGNLCLLRDPSAVLPLFHRRSHGLDLVFSDVDLARQTGLMPLAIDWEGMAHYLLYPQLQAGRTCVSGVREVRPGERVTLETGRVSTDLLWEPWRFAATTAPLPDPGDAATRLAAVVDRSVAAWATCFGRIHLELSGGLDSSIIAAALARSGADWWAATVVTQAGDGDERLYAAAVTERLNTRLLEILPSSGDADPLTLYSRLTPRPRDTRMLAGLDRRKSESADQAGADALFNGLGGDNVFFSTGGTAPIADAWRHLGRQPARQVALDIATITHAPLLSVYSHLLRRRIVDRLGRSWPPDRRLLHRDVRRPPEPHPWLDVPPGTDPGTRAHIGTILRIHGLLDGVDRSATHSMIFPLLSQPILEACLAIPSWYWVRGGRDRAIAREAYAGRLPDAVLRRRTKGRVDSLVVGAFERRRGALRSLLLEGVLADAGLLDRPAIEHALSAPSSDRVPIHDRLMQLADAELWVRAILDAAPSGARL